MQSFVPERGDVPGVHALVIGVSRYRHLFDGEDPTDAGRRAGMGQLSTAAASAAEFAAWLLHAHKLRGRPLASLRLLLSPTAGEALPAAIQTHRNRIPAATKANVVSALGAFRQACEGHRDNIAFVYVAGHGVAVSKHDATVLLEDFGHPASLTELDASLAMASVHEGFNDDRCARQQFWFVDCCRQPPAAESHYASLAGGIGLDSRPGSAEVSPLYLAAAPDQRAYAKPGQVSLFYAALREALEQGAAAESLEPAQQRWEVTVNGLNTALPAIVKAAADAHGVKQDVYAAGRHGQATLHEFDDAPRAQLCLSLDPASEGATARASLLFNASQLVADNLAPWPIEQQDLTSGLYLVRVRLGNGRDCDNLIRVAPRRTEKTIRVGA